MSRATSVAAKAAADASLWHLARGFLLIYLITCAVYLPALQGTPVWDDDAHITKPALRSLHGLWRIWFDVHATAQYYPLLHSAFWIEQKLFGDTVSGYHLVNILLHATAACLVVMIARRLAWPGAWLAGALFAVHPVCVESVAWISEQKNTLSAVLGLGAVLLYLEFDRNARASRYWIASALFVMALLSKTTAATIPAALLVILWWRRGRLEWRRHVLPLTPWLALGAVAGLFTAWVESTIIGAQRETVWLSATQKIVLAGHAIWFYFGKLLWPAHLMFTYPHWTIDATVWTEWLYPIGVVAVLAAAVVIARRYRGPLASMLVFVLMLFPVLGFVNVFPFRYSYVADHFQYLASLGILAPAASALTLLLGRSGSLRARAWVVTVPLVTILAGLTWHQSGEFRSAETLYRATLAKNPASWMAHTNLGNILAQDPERLPQAINQFEAALRLKPDDAEAHLDLGGALAHLPGGLPLAEKEFRIALKLRPEYADAHFNLAIALSRDPAQLADAISEYRAALRVNPDLAQAHNNLGNLLTQTPDGLPEAMAEYRSAIRIDPDYVDAHFNLGRALAQTPGQKAAALREFQTALRLKPDLEPAMQAIAVLSTGP